MKNVPNKIRLNKNLWFTFLGNKLVFGNSAISKGYHYTFSFGNRSGIFDLHLTNKKGEHFTVIKISHQNVYEILPALVNQIIRSVAETSSINEYKYYENKSVLYIIDQEDDILADLFALTKKNKLVIDKDSLEFKSFVDKLREKQTLKLTELSEAKKHSRFIGLVQSNNEEYFIIKNPFLGNEILKLNNLDFEITSVFKKILSKDVYYEILDKINNGILYLNE